VMSNYFKHYERLSQGVLKAISNFQLTLLTFLSHEMARGGGDCRMFDSGLRVHEYF